MEKFRVNGCCCCFNLETGVIIIGAFELFIGISSIIFGGAHIGGDPLYGSVSLIEGVLLIICGTFLILGVRKSKPTYFLLFLLLALIFVVKYFIELIYHLYKGFTADKINGAELTGQLLADVLVVGLGIYFFLVVYSLYELLKGGSSNRNTV